MLPYQTPGTAAGMGLSLHSAYHIHLCT